MIQWPPHTKIYCYNRNDEEIARSKRSRLDLADELMLNYSGDMPRVCFIEVSTKAEGWTTWNSSNVKEIEQHIKYDLEFDGYLVEVHRISKAGKTLCQNPFRWQLEISSEPDEEEADTSSNRNAVGSRFKVARSDASIRTIQKQIEKVFGLPKGSVCLLTPENKKANPKSSIKRLRDKWKNG